MAGNKMAWSDPDIQHVVQIAEKFTDRVAEALQEAGIKKENAYGFVLGWAYGQLRQRFSKEQVREIFEQVIEKSEREIASFAKS